MKVYIYKPDKTTFQDDWLYAADMGFKQLNATIIYFDDIASIPYAPDNIVIAFIEDTISYFKHHKISYPKPINIPAELRPFKYRVGKNITFKEAKEKDHKFFIKPVSELKQFPSGVISNGLSLSRLINIPDEEMVYVGWPVNMISEYRCFIYNRQLVGIKQYSGDIRYFPNINDVDKMIEAYNESPIAYTLDVAVQEHKDKPEGVVTSIVECNDMWSVGHYGLDQLIYAKMLRDRWFQITRQQ